MIIPPGSTFIPSFLHLCPYLIEFLAIEISYKELIVTFELFQRDKYDEKEIKYRYKLEPFDREWVRCAVVVLP